MADVKETGRDDQRQTYKREGDKQVVVNELSKFELTETVQNMGSGTAKIEIKIKAAADTTLTGAFLCFDLPADDYSGSQIQLIDSAASTIDTVFAFSGQTGKNAGCIPA